MAELPDRGLPSGSPRQVAALYIDPRGPYPQMPRVDCWGEERDAREYFGPHAVVAHPPCGPWGALQHLYEGSEHDCAIRAVTQVRMFGGVLEHPARSRLWEGRLPRPGEPRDEYGGYTIEVCQVSWGHVARKRTWLYLVRVDAGLLAATIRTGGTPTHWISGFRPSNGRSSYKANGSAVPQGIKVCSAQQRRRTPPAFAEWLVMLARSVNGSVYRTRTRLPKETSVTAPA